jgi:hypothetical protein
MKKIGCTLLVVMSTLLVVKSENQVRNLPAFTEISLRIQATLYVEQGAVQKVEIDAPSSDLDEIITEVRDRALVVRYPAKNYFRKPSKKADVIIRVTIPEITELNLSGSGDIVGDNDISTRIMDLNISGSGNIRLGNLLAERVKASIAGSGNIHLEGNQVTTDFTGNIAGSGNIRGENFEAQNVKVNITGSGDCSIRSNGDIRVRIAGSGNFYYSGNPNIDSSIAGSGKVSEVGQ